MWALHPSQAGFRGFGEVKDSQIKIITQGNCVTPEKSGFDQPVPCGMLLVFLFVSPLLDTPVRDLWIQLPAPVPHWNLP